MAGAVIRRHFNPLVTLALLLRGDIEPRIAVAYVPIQIMSAVAGVGIANVMFDAPAFSLSTNVRSGPSQLLGEFISTFGLIGAIWVCSRLRPASVAGVVAAYIGGAFWFTPTDFANPAVTIARCLTNTFAGIRPVDVPEFIATETMGALAAVVLFRWLLPERAHAGN